jgi:hypothetical protein
VSNHGKHFENEVFAKLSKKIDLLMKHPPTTHSPMGNLKQSIRSLKQCYNEPYISIRPIGITLFSHPYGHIA